MLRLGQICGIRLPMGGRTHETMMPRNLKNPLSKSLIALGINPYHSSQERVSMFMLSKLSVSSLCATQQSMSEPGDFYCFISLVDWCEVCQPDCDATTHNLSRLLQSGQNFGQLASCHGIETSSFILVYLRRIIDLVFEQTGSLGTKVVERLNGCCFLTFSRAV